ncbi:DUF885 domain-containing protein [Pseudobacteriovorax antillogorgiicola]|nr:DUF885 domain-containing protein [Pseudobacteriovorax antillogorgiicola]
MKLPILIWLALSSFSLQANSSQWSNFTDTFLEELWLQYPVWATQVGYHKYDEQLPAPNSKNLENELVWLRSNQSKLENVNPKDLGPHQRSDFLLIKNFIDKQIWYAEVFKEHLWNPATYNVGGAFAGILESSTLQNSQKAARISKRLSLVPAYYEAAQNILQTPTREHLDLAIQQSQGLLGLFQRQLKNACSHWLNKSNDVKLCLARHQLALNAVKNYGSFLDELKNRTKKFRSFRIGSDLYQSKYQLEIQGNLSAHEVYQKALKRKEELHSEMVPRASKLWNKYFPDKTPPKDERILIKSVLEKLSDRHVKPKDFIASIKRQIPELEQFVKQSQVVELDPTKPLKVRETPPYMRGFAGASINAPGPYDSKRETYYNVTPLDHMTPTEAESYLREYNHYMMQILNIHEAIPGHYTQLIYANKAPSLIKKILGNGTMIEGWAVYSEKMMLEEGYGQDRDELLLTYGKWHLRVVCNAILDYSVHNLNMSEEQGLKLLMDDAFQQRAEAEGKWRRATLSQVQLSSYFAGFTEIFALREQLKKQKGEKFDLRQFHDEFLSFGSAPVKVIRQLMIRDKQET